MHNHPMLTTFLELSFDRAREPLNFDMRNRCTILEGDREVDVMLAECCFSQMPSPSLL